MAPPKRLQEVIEFCKRQQENFIHRLFSDVTYREMGFDLHSAFEPTEVKQHAAGSVVILNDRPNWEKCPTFALRITDRDMIGTRVAK